MKTLKIDISKLRETGRIDQIIESYLCQAIEESVRHQNLKISYTLILAGDAILCSGEVTGEMTLECCRCLSDFNYPVTLRFEQSYPVETEEIDLEDEVRQILILNLPGKPLCHANCAGLCPQCGKNRNAGTCNCSEQLQEPKWEKLKDLIK